jgi:aspartyl-tRNA(Asn)/glutamyl-tRNA(Gln) amidotransferase subunit C
MSIAIDEIKHAAHLAGLRLSESELLKFQKELSSIPDYIQQLRKMAANTVMASDRIAITLSDVRNDTVCRSLAAVDALNNAPSVRVGMFNVPKVI